VRPSRTDRHSPVRRGARDAQEHPGRDARTVLKVGQDFYILASALASRRTTRVLADGRSFAVFEAGGDILDSPSEALGLFHRDTRYLSLFELKVAGETPYLLNSYLSDDNAQLRVNLTNPDLGVQGGAIELRRDAIQIERSWVLSEPSVFHRVIVRNFARTPVRLPIEFAFAVDFADLFQVRGIKRRRRGEAMRPEAAADTVRFRYRGIDEVRRTTEIFFTPRPHSLSDGRATFLLNLKPDERAEIEVRINVASDSPRELPARHGINRFDQALASRCSEIARLGESCARVSASNEYLDSLLRRSAADLISIVSTRPEGVYMMAGIPWFATLFGRDSIVTATAMLPFCPDLAGRTLQTLAALQGAEVNERRDEQPGKIVHEVRSGEMAATGEVPFGRYYGSVDSTPLFLWLYGRYAASTGDLALAEELWPNAQRAIAWIEKWGDRDGDGYVEYVRESARGLANQGWKDSVDAISHADGGLARAPIALCEVQGYVYGAYKMAAQAASRLNHNDAASRMRERATALRENFLRDFWLEKEGTVALALDADKRPCRVMASNAAHCLASGLLNQEQSEILARRLMAEEMFSGWGVRTLSANERRYNPMSYHNGSVWPHDNAIAAVGLARLEGREGVLRVLDGLLDAAVKLQAGSLPELFCGFAREPRLGPVPYPVACHPQAWAAGSIFMILQAMLGIRVMALERRLVIDSPVMPSWLEWLRIDDLSVGAAKVSFMVRRTPNGAAVEVTEKRGQVMVEVRK
jgi:glycogen debranching enzyme